MSVAPHEPEGPRSSTSLHAYRVAFPRRWWYPACRSTDLRRTPLGITLMDTPLVLFRDAAGEPRALLDRCAHRNLALSLGRVHVDGCIECAYHGWRFDGWGRCTEVPGLGPAGGEPAARGVAAHATTERDDFVWVWGEAAAEPTGVPFALPSLTGSRQVVLVHDLECSLHAALENVLDVPHTAHIHKGLFRGGTAREITATRRDVPGGIEVQYVGEPVRFGPLRPPTGDLTFDHWDRFFVPSVAQVEYRVRGWFHLVNTVVHLPLSPFRTRAWFVVRFSSALPAPLVRAIVAGQGRRILRQDAAVLRHQTDNLRRFGRAQYASTDLDLTGPAIWRLLLHAEGADVAEAGNDASGRPGDGAPAGSAGNDAETSDAGVTGDDGRDRHAGGSVTFRA